MTTSRVPNRPFRPRRPTLHSLTLPWPSQRRQRTSAPAWHRFPFSPYQAVSTRIPNPSRHPASSRTRDPAWKNELRPLQRPHRLRICPEMSGGLRRRTNLRRRLRKLSMTTAVSESQPIAVGKVAKANRSPAARQLVFAKATSPVTVPTTTTTRVTTTYSELRNTRPLSYSKVAGGVVPSSATVEGQVEDGLHGTSLPPVISNILSQVGQTRSPIVWNEMFYASTRQNCNENEEPKETGSNESHEVSQQPLTVSTPGGLFKPLPHEVSPPNPSGASPASSSSPTLNATPSPPAALSSATEDSEKPCIRPIGTERAHWRTNTSPSTTLGGVVPLISTGKLVCRTQVKVAQGVSTLLDDQ